MANRNTAIRGVQIRDAEVTEDQLNVSVNASLDLADSALQPADVDGVTIDVGSGGALEVLPGGIDLSLCNNATSEFITLDDLPADLTGILESAVVVQDLTGNADTSLVLADAPVAGSLQLFINGLLQQEGSGKDYTIAGTSITLSEATEADDLIIAHYIDAV